MATRHNEITPELMHFITEQPMFFVASAAEGRVNMSPKDLYSLRALDPLGWLG